ncbi:MAG: SidJ-related pseudokinase [Proteobacteria bacterium]|nr:SidJ-related pseudokinase [Pseudomonadota bacterium]
MNNIALKRQKNQSENELIDESYDFSAKYLAVWHLHHLIETSPHVIDFGTISILKNCLKDSIITRQTQAYFMYKQIAGTLCSVIIHAEHLADQALSALLNLLATTSGYPHRAVAEALGDLPFSINGPRISKHYNEKIPNISLHEILNQSSISISTPPTLIGRSLVAVIDQEKKLLVIKLARIDEPPHMLYKEPLWMHHLRSQHYSFPVRFNIPKPIKIHGSYTFRLREIPLKIPLRIDLHPEHYAIGFIADKDYFVYPNDTIKEQRPSFEELREMLTRNAWLLGKLSAEGIIHSAPIPLFHNRVQRQRRNDHGLYEWRRAGRLDRWLESCSYPNLGLSGIRDFEHLICFKGMSRNIYNHIGVHILSLLLIAGSYFRNKDKSRVGIDRHGKPVDARDLFDEQFLKELVNDIFHSYYHGFVGMKFRGKIPVDLERLACRMIEEMGVDRYMEEILRIADQNEITDDEFTDYLKGKEYSQSKIKNFEKGAKDIVIESGPHLGEFNHGISLPEIIEAVETISALSIVGRYLSSAHPAFPGCEASS